MVRWIKSKTNPVGVALTDMQGSVAASDADVADCIYRFWSDFWRDSAARPPSRQQRVETCWPWCLHMKQLGGLTFPVRIFVPLLNVLLALVGPMVGTPWRSKRFP